MNFTVTYRTTSGARTVETVEATSRAEVFAKMKARGITPLSVAASGKLPRPKKPAAGGNRTVLRGAIAGILVVLVALAAWYFLAPSEKPAPKPAPKAAKPKPAPKVAKPSPAPKPKPVETNVVAKAPAPVKIDPNARPERVGEIVNGYIKLPSGKIHKIRGEVTNDVSRTSVAKYEIFPHHTDNEIACFLTMTPGEGLVGDPRYKGHFKEEFLESLKVPIVIEPDDDEYTRNLKQAVKETRNNLKDALDRGEDIEQIMADTRREMQDLHNYKRFLQNELSSYRKQEGVTDDDVEAFISAADKLLAEKGIAPLKVGPITKKRMELLMKEKEERKMNQ